jgi:hypothetical protein
MRGAIPPLPIRLHGVVLSFKERHRNFTLTFLEAVGSSDTRGSFEATAPLDLWAPLAIEVSFILFREMVGLILHN